MMDGTVKLPEAFLNRMRDMLNEDYEAFVRSYDEERAYGLRVNPLKCDKERFTEIMPFELTRVEWASEGYYYVESERPGKHVYHEAGAYYIQEPSAMSAVALLDPQPGEKVLDLCAAPGGKSTQIAGRLMGEGLLVSNEPERERARILSQNIERLGIRNCVVTNEMPDRLSPRFTGFFDRILVDAPCSGEGMFRKDENAVKEWSPENVEMCAKRQAGILDEAAKMLRPGGIMVYSTCTFSKAENEDNIASFLERHREFTLEKSERLMPHKIKGEGHFVARLVKSVSAAVEYSYEESAPVSRNAGRKPDKKERTAVSSYSEKDLKEFLINEAGVKKETAEGLLQTSCVNVFGENIYLTPKTFGPLSGLSVVRPGLHIASDLGKRIEPAHALAMSLRKNETERYVEVTMDEAKKYLRGETIPVDPGIKGWCVVFADSFSVGYGKATGGILKNHYPKGLRVEL